MKRLFITILMTAASIGFTSTASAAMNEKKATYEAAKDKADSEYKTAAAQCASLTGNPKDICMAEAKAVRTHSKTAANVEYKNTLKARTDARKENAEADYKVSHEKCESKTGNEKDVCMKEAKSDKVAAMSDAKATKKVVEARTDARDDKMTAEYKVAMEKCDALSGSTKDSCVASAKGKFGK